MGNRWFKNIQNFVSRTADTSSFNTAAIAVEEILNFSIQCIWTETGISGASVTIQGSNDGVNFNEDPDVSSVTISSDSSTMFNLSNRAYKEFRIAVTIGGGTLDTFIAHVHLKDSG